MKPSQSTPDTELDAIAEELRALANEYAPKIGYLVLADKLNRIAATVRSVARDREASEIEKAAKRYALATVRFSITEIDEPQFQAVVKELNDSQQALLRICDPIVTASLQAMTNPSTPSPDAAGPTPDSLALAWRKRATQSEMEMEELMAGLRKVSADDLKTEGYHDLTPEQQAAVDDFAREMQEVVIPRIVESQRERARIAAEARHRVLFT